MSKIWFTITTTTLCLGFVCSTEAQHARPKLPVPKGAAPAQVLPNAAGAPGGTIWHHLGIPQGMERLRKFRDSRVNRDGNNPMAERKPQLKPLNHEDFLKEDADPLLKKAAEAKIANDLAPQKIKALKYIAALGCGCSKQDFEDAILAGMEDCVEEVRAEAVQAVITSASSGNCGTEECPIRRKGILACKHGNCDPGSQDGIVVHLSDCPPMGSGCAACGSCCTYKIQEKLKKLAFKLDQDNCFVEPSPRVRSLAEQALNLCPMRPAPQDTKPEGGQSLGSEGGSETDASDASDPGKILDELRRILNQDSNPERLPDTRDNAGARNGRGVHISIKDSSPASYTPTQKVSASLTPGVPRVILARETEIESADDYLLECRVVSQNGVNRILLSFPVEYTLPADALAMAIDGAGNQQLCQISHSVAGQAIIRPADSDTFSIARSNTLKLGILEN